MKFKFGVLMRDYFPFFIARRSRLDFAFGASFAKSPAICPAFGAIDLWCPKEEYFIPLRL